MLLFCFLEECKYFIYFRLGNCASVVVNTIKERNIVGVGASTSICSVIGFDLIYRILKVDGR